MGKPVVHFEIHGKNSEGLFRFYAEIFGWTVDANNPLKYGMVETQAGKGIAGGMCASEMGPTVLVYIEVEDPQAYLDRIEAAGGTTVLPVTELPGSITLAIFTDPEGNKIGLIKG